MKLLKRFVKKFNKLKNKLQDNLDNINSFYYVTEYPLDLCLQYMQNDNVYDVFSYTWEKREGFYLLTFVQYKNSFRQLSSLFAPSFIVQFENVEEKIGVNVSYVSNIMQPFPMVDVYNIDAFWEKKLNAKRIK